MFTGKCLWRKVEVGVYLFRNVTKKAGLTLLTLQCPARNPHPGRPKVTCPPGCPPQHTHSPQPRDLTRTAGWPRRSRARCAAASPSSGARRRGSPATAQTPPAARSPRWPPQRRPPPPAALRPQPPPPFPPALPPAAPRGEPGVAAPAPRPPESGILPQRAPAARGSPSSAALPGGDGHARGRAGAPGCRRRAGGGSRRGARTAGRRLWVPRDVSPAAAGAPPGGSGCGQVRAEPGRGGGSGGLGGLPRAVGARWAGSRGPGERDPLFPHSCREAEGEARLRVTCLKGSQGDGQNQLDIVPFSSRGHRSPIGQPWRLSGADFRPQRPPGQCAGGHSQPNHSGSR